MSMKQHRRPKNRDQPDSLSALKRVVFKPKDLSSFGFPVLNLAYVHLRTLFI
jgi:hypothetical protein